MNTITHTTEQLRRNLLMLIDFKKEANDKDLRVGDHVKVSKYKNIFAKGSNQIGMMKFL